MLPYYHVIIVLGLSWLTPEQAQPLAAPVPDQRIRQPATCADRQTAPAPRQNHSTIQVSADAAIVDRQQQQIQARGTVVWQRPDLHLNADWFTYRLRDQSGQAHQVRYYLPATSARGSAAQATLQDGSRSHYQHISYTTCPPEQTDWQLQAEQLMLDQSAGWGTLHHATLRFLDVPVGYTPWLRFPLDDRRQSGFLPPSVGYSAADGIRLKIPYYLNLAPDYDLTLTPVILGRRGLLFGSEWRLLTRTTQSKIQADYLPHDRQYTGRSRRRGYLAWRSQSRYNPQLYSRLDLNYVSDKDYLTDFSDTLSAASTTLLPSSVALGYQTDDWHIQARLNDYQRLNTSSQPYRMLPQITLHKRDASQRNQLQYHLDAELVRFDQPGDTMIEGTRLDIVPGISWPQQTSYYHLTPKLGLRYTRYQLNQAPHSRDRFSQHLSLDGGLSFERPFAYRGRPGLQTLEPRIQYQYIRARKQDDLPMFDTSARSVNIRHLFREGRFSGADRVGDTNQIAVGLTTRLLDAATYRDYLTASLGQILYFRDRQVTLPGQAPATSARSALVGNLRAELGPHWQISSEFTRDSDTSDQFTLQTAYQTGDIQRAGITYRRHAAVTEHADIRLDWPLTETILLMSRWQYDLNKQRTREAILGMEYRTCCWRLRALAHNMLDKQEQNDLSFLFQIELNGLGKFGQRMDRLLR